ncbi:hypothetical protein [Pedobacter sp. P26]|uniref:hypothetical protein n=1 Tax=Pedobacter sp. P26 TaxID=3423956 RepID=UPI003D667481
MNNTKAIIYLLVPIFLLGLVLKSKAQAKGQSDKTIITPDSIWKEHWFEHQEELKLIESNSNVAVFYDKNMSSNIKWPIAVMADCWAYVKRNYGDFGPDPKLYVILHRAMGKDYGGGHPSPFLMRAMITGTLSIVV